MARNPSAADAPFGCRPILATIENTVRRRNTPASEWRGQRTAPFASNIRSARKPVSDARRKYRPARLIPISG
jgi:hypothetical protein